MLLQSPLNCMIIIFIYRGTTTVGLKNIWYYIHQTVVRKSKGITILSSAVNSWWGFGVEEHFLLLCSDYVSITQRTRDASDRKLCTGTSDFLFTGLSILAISTMVEALLNISLFSILPFSDPQSSSSDPSMPISSFIRENFE